MVTGLWYTHFLNFGSILILRVQRTSIFLKSCLGVRYLLSSAQNIWCLWVGLGSARRVQLRLRISLRLINILWVKWCINTSLEYHIYVITTYEAYDACLTPTFCAGEDEIKFVKESTRMNLKPQQIRKVLGWKFDKNFINVEHVRYMISKVLSSPQLKTSEFLCVPRCLMPLRISLPHTIYILFLRRMHQIIL